MKNLDMEEAFKTHNEETNSLTILNVKNKITKQNVAIIYSTV
jgi:hypothetical protein